MRRHLSILLLAAACASPLPEAANVRGEKGYCPICRMWHDAALLRWPATYGGKTFRFCDPNCRAAFQRDPEGFAKDADFNPAGSGR